MLSQSYQAELDRYNAEQRAKARFLYRILSYLPLCVIWALLLYFTAFQPGWDFQTIATLSLFAAIFAIGLSIIYGPYRLNFVTIYLVYLSLAHLGLVTSDLLVPDSRYSFLLRINLNIANMNWYFTNTPLTTYAVALSGLAIASLGISAGFWSLRRASSHSQILPSFQSGGDRTIFYVGTALLVFCTLYIVLMVAFGALPLFASYAEFRDASERVFGYSFFLIVLAVGLTFVLATGSGKQIRRSITFFILPAVFLLMTGNRGEVLYPAAAAIVVLSARGFRLRALSIFLLVLLFFVVIPAIRQIRQTRLTEIDLGDITIAATDPFIELGFQLRPLTVTVDWIDAGEPLAHGETYWLPVQRMIGLIMPLIERPPIEGSRLDLTGRTPTQGYSVVAEAYFNFGYMGAVVVFALIGFYLSWFANQTGSTLGLAFHSAVFATLINNIRNSFIFVPGHLVVIVAIVVIAHLLSKREKPVITP